MNTPVLAPVYPAAPLSRDIDSVQHVPPGRLLTILLRHRMLITALTLLISLPTIAFIITRNPFYDATALLMIDTGKASFHDLQASITTAETDAIALSTQVGILLSPALAADVVDRLDLTHQPEFAKVLDAPPSVMARIMQRLALLFGETPSDTKALSTDQRRELAASLLIGKMKVLNDGKSYIISVRARTGNAKLSTQIANAYADAYLDFKRQLKVAAIRRANSLLDEKIAPIAARVQRADAAVQDYRARNGLIVSPLTGQNRNDDGSGTTVADQQLALVNNALISARGEVAEYQATYREIAQALQQGQLDAIPQVVASPLISSLRTQQAELASHIASLGQSEMAENPNLQAARAAGAALHQRISEEVSKIAASVKRQADAANARVASLQAELAHLQGQVSSEGQANVTLRQLESEALAVRGIYQDYLRRFEQTSNQSSLQEAEADLVSPAEIPLGKSGPPRMLLSLLSLVTAGFIACVTALLVERMRGGVRSLEQLEQSTGLAGLGFVPRLPACGLAELYRAQRASIYGEAVGRVAGLIRFGGERYRARTVLVTSALPGEGKTTFSISLAAGIGREGGRALLIDCDMHRPAIARSLGIKMVPTNTSSGAMLHENVLEGMDVVTFYPVVPSQRALVTSLQLQSLLNDASRRYDMIILDAPPALAFADTPVMSLKADGAIMVVQWRSTPIHVVATAVRSLESYGVRLLGGVVTQVRLNDVAEEDGGHAYLYQRYASYFREETHAGV